MAYAVQVPEFEQAGNRAAGRQPYSPNNSRDGGSRVAMQEFTGICIEGQRFLGSVVTTSYGFLVYNHDLQVVKRHRWYKGGNSDWHRTVASMLAFHGLGFKHGVSFLLKPYESIAVADEGFAKWGWTRRTRPYSDAFVLTTNYGVWSEDEKAVGDDVNTKSTCPDLRAIQEMGVLA